MRTGAPVKGPVRGARWVRFVKSRLAPEQAFPTNLGLNVTYAARRIDPVGSLKK
jgi:hypothetical protein